MARTRRTFTRDFKLAAVQLVKVQGYSVAEAAKSLGIGDTLLRNWMAKLSAEGDAAFPGRGHRPPLEEEVHRLRAENKRLQMERDILKKAAAYFAAQTQ